MPFPWSNKLSRVSPVAPPSSPEVQPVSVSEPIEVAQTVEIPTVDDKISSIEHKNGECLVSPREEDDEAHEVEGELQEGGRAEESDHGGEEVVARVED
jgi:hypothetical protein